MVRRLKHTPIVKGVAPGTAKALAALLLATAAVVGFLLWDTPVPRAQDFIKMLVLEPSDTEKLRDIANTPTKQSPVELLSGLDTRVGIDYLRASYLQGVKLKFSYGEIQRKEPRKRIVTVMVTQAETVGRQDHARRQVRFQVDMGKDQDGEWRITRVLADD